MDNASEAQIGLIYRLMDRKHISGSVARKIIDLLSDAPDAGSNGLDLEWMKTEVNESKRRTEGSEGQSA